MSISVKISGLLKEDVVATTERVSLPTLTGRIEILPNHVPLMAGLAIGVLEWGKAGIACNRLVTNSGLAIVLKNEVKIYLRGWEKVESREEIAPQIETINGNIARMQEELAELKAQGAKSGPLTEKQNLIGIEKARLDLARRVGLSV